MVDDGAQVRTLVEANELLTLKVLFQHLGPEVKPPASRIVFLIHGVLALLTVVRSCGLDGNVLDEMCIAVSLLIPRLVSAARLFAILQRAFE